MIKVMQLIKDEIESLGYLVDFVLPDFEKQQKNNNVLMLNYKVLSQESDFCGRTTYTSQINVVCVSKQRDDGDEWYQENHNILEEIGEHFMMLTKNGNYQVMDSVTSYKFNELGVDSAMRYVNEIQINVICHG